MEELKIKPLADRIMVKEEVAETLTPGGIIIPDASQEKPNEGVVVAVGPGNNDYPVTLSVGDRVMFGKYTGTEISFGGEVYLLMREADIFAYM